MARFSTNPNVAPQARHRASRLAQTKEEVGHLPRRLGLVAARSTPRDRAGTMETAVAWPVTLRGFRSRLAARHNRRAAPADTNARRRLATNPCCPARHSWLSLPRRPSALCSAQSRAWTTERHLTARVHPDQAKLSSRDCEARWPEPECVQRKPLLQAAGRQRFSQAMLSLSRSSRALSLYRLASR